MNVIAPVTGSTVHVPSPGTTKLVTGRPVAGSIIMTVVGSISIEGSLPRTSTTTVLPSGLPSDSSGVSSGGITNEVGTLSLVGSPSPLASATAPSWEVSVTVDPPGPSAVTSAELSYGPVVPPGSKVTERTWEQVSVAFSVDPTHESETTVEVNDAAEANADARSSLMTGFDNGRSPVFSATSVYSSVNVPSLLATGAEVMSLASEISQS